MDIHQEDEFDFLECAICLSTMSDIVTPFSMNSKEGNKACKHGFCFVCLAPYFKLQQNKIAEHKGGTGTIDCPVCREPFDGFIVNSISNRLFETSKKYFSATKMLKNELALQKTEYNKQIEELEKKESDSSEYVEKIQKNSKSGEKISDLEGALSCVKVEQCKLENQIETLCKKNRMLEKEIEELHQKNAMSVGGSLSSLSNLTDTYFEKLKKTNFSSLIAGVTGGGSPGKTNSEFIASFKELNVGEQRGSSKNSIVKKVAVPKVGPAALKQIKYQVATGLAYYSTYYGGGVAVEQDIRAFRESMLLHRMNHANIVKLSKITKDDSGRFYSIITPFVEYDLDYVLASKRAKSRIVPAVELKFVAYQLLSAISYMHAQEVVHRDIRPTSILVYEDYQIRLCSFSLACSVLIDGTNNNNNSLNNSNNGGGSTGGSGGTSEEYSGDEFVNITPSTNNSGYKNGIIIPPYNNYSPPEILLTSGVVQTRSIDWKAVDLWSVGCVLAEMALSISQSTQTALFTGMDRNNLLKQICNLKECCPANFFASQKIGMQVNPTKSLGVELQPQTALSPSKSQSASETVTRDYIDLVTRLLKFDPNQRISAHDALQHRFFVNESYFNNHPPSFDDIASSLTDRNINEFIKEKGIL
ncbi:RING zinc finger-containing protein [Cavenderia fasciculata]|uniref:RING zinc finger-containing protein n=1 Tax=Cavenderia fasciculata TaxID=261658 RepID=F4Q4C6_CACFS|nr:RING zinc finger-containing protein [Cavenderia fasciculata]EGG16988.1 RING zinc finger-containing protein [Cavenderia fasciculata]|eukprot:XP_004355472.1 RING zinc finger-containing protein [Cavenderia fasciculata]